MNLKNLKLATKLILVITGIVVATMAVTTFTANRLLTEELESGLKRDLQAAHGEIMTVVKSEKGAMALQAKALRQNDNLIKGLSQGDRGSILSEASKIFEQIKDEGVEILEIGNAQGVVLVRAHNPEKYGDNKADYPLLKKALGGESGADFEMGKSGLAIRGMAPIVDPEGKVLGTVMVGKRMSNEWLDDIKKDTGAEITIFAGNKRIATTVMQEGQRAVGTTQDDPKVLDPVLKQGQTYYGEAKVLGNPYLVLYAPLRNAQGENLGMIFSGMPKEMITKVHQKNTYSLMLVALLATLGACGVGYYVSLQIVRPINKLAAVAEKVSQGDLREKIESQDQDEVGLLTRAFSQMVDNLKGLINDVSSAVGQINLSTKELALTAEETAKSADQVAQTVEQLAAGAEEQTRHVNQTSDNIKEVAQLVNGVVSDTQQIAANSSKAAEKAHQGGKVLENAILQMEAIKETVNQSALAVDGLGQRSQEIGNIVEMITTIAEQTNLLALNAAIEAARAGEQGRGFAVVAEEVRKLAEESASAANQISNLIREVQKETEKTVQVMSQGEVKVAEGVNEVFKVGEVFQQIIQGIEAITKQIQGIARAAEDTGERNKQVVLAVDNIASIVEESAASTEEVSATTEEQTASVEEIAAAADGLARMAEELQAAVAKFKV